MKLPIMKCGCAAQATCASMDGIKYDPQIPACLVHDCIEIAEKQPDLTGRKSRCAYFGKPTRNCECNYDGCREGICNCEQPSSPNLPFFEYHGPGSHWAKDFCKCGFILGPAHGFYTNGKPNPSSCIAKGGTPEPRGPSEFDKFYCGCHGWD